MKRTGMQTVRMVLLILGALVFVLPLAWMLSTALKPVDQTMSMPPRWLPVLWSATAEGQPQEVHVDRATFEDALETEAETVEAFLAYQWTAAVDGRTLPVRTPRGFAHTPVEGSGEVEVAYQTHWISVAHDQYPVRVLDNLAEVQGDAEVRVYVIPPKSMQYPATVRRSDLVLRYDTTTKQVEQSYSFENTAQVARADLKKTYIAWDDRAKLPFTHTEKVTLPVSELSNEVAPRWGNFAEAIDEMKFFPRYLANTLILCFLTVIGTTLSSAVVAYGFSRIDWPGREKVFLIVLATMMIPFPVTMVPLYGLFKSLDWIGTLRPLWVPAFFAGAFNIFLLRQFFRTIPKELSEAARIDGCNEFRIFWQVVLPLAKPALTVVALFQFLATWNDFLGPLIYLTDQSDFTLALGLQFFQSQHGGTPWHLLMAASTLIVIPVIVLFFLAQRFFVEGVSMSGLKG